MEIQRPRLALQLPLAAMHYCKPKQSSALQRDLRKESSRETRIRSPQKQSLRSNMTSAKFHTTAFSMQEGRFRGGGLYRAPRKRVASLTQRECQASQVLTLT